MITPLKKFKPVGVISMELHGYASAVAPAGPAVIPFLSIKTRTPFAVSWDESDAGKVAYYAARWLNRRGQPGPWSAIASMTVAA